MQFTTRFPLVPEKDVFHTVSVGSALLPVGEVRTVYSAFDRSRREDLVLLDHQTLPAAEVPEERLRTLGLHSTEGLLRALAKAYGTSVPERIPVTLYTFAPANRLPASAPDPANGVHVESVILDERSEESKTLEERFGVIAASASRRRKPRVAVDEGGEETDGPEEGRHED